MAINPLKSSARAKAAIAVVMAGVSAGAYPAYERLLGPGEALDPAVVIAVEKLITPWEGLVLKSHWDRFGKRWDICYGETKDIGPGMVKTPAECREMLLKRVDADYRDRIVECAPKLAKAPASVRASMISGSYNFGVGAWCRSTAKKLIDAGNWRGACSAQTAFNKAGGQVVRGLVNRREMGDAQRIGEAELCLSGIP